MVETNKQTRAQVAHFILFLHMHKPQLLMLLFVGCHLSASIRFIDRNEFIEEMLDLVQA